MGRYVWQSAAWPQFEWDSMALLVPLGRTRAAQGRLLAQGDYLGLELHLEVLAQEVVTSAAIEGERLSFDSVRSSVARRLGLPVAGLPPGEGRAEGLVEMLIDATANHHRKLDEERLMGWQAALFPTGYSGLRKIAVGRWRSPAADPMQVVSGPLGKEKVHYEAPPARGLDAKMKRFLEWWSDKRKTTEGLVRAAIAHLWFVTIHPFEDGNGRLARAVAEMALSQDEGTGRRMYSMSAQINSERNMYYDVLEHTQKGKGDITDWLVWFLGCLERAIARSKKQVETATAKGRFWQQTAALALNQRQRKVVNRLLDSGPSGFEGGLTTRKFSGMTKVSPSTAKRDIAELLEMGIIVRRPGGGRSSSYDLVWSLVGGKRDSH